jgi:hemoglobin/transferrin/lactoferrin receptor protein
MNLRLTALALLMALPCALHAQADSNAIRLNEVVIGANKFEENKKSIVQPIQLIKKKEIQWIMPQNTGLLLEQTGNVFVQKSQMGGSSPVIRGFEANRVQLVIDGVRMNNAVYRAGHLQNVITVDNNMLESVEILYGPASTLYGSDALGGVVIMNTLKPQLGLAGNAKAGANAMLRYSSANNEITGHADFNIGGKKLASLTSITYSKFGDLRKGSFHPNGYDSLGLRYDYVERIGGVDSVLANSDPNLQKQSGYSQVDILEKLLYQQNDKISHTLNLQYSNSSDVPRYDRLTDRRAGNLRWAQWYYGPQQRLMAAYQFNAKNLNGFFNEMQAGVNYQDIEESRHQRERGRNGLQSRVENIGVLGYNIDFRKFMGRHELTLGTDGQYNTVRSTATEKDIVSGETAPIDTRYPDGGSTMYLGAVYAQHIWKIVSDKLVLNDGLRFSYVSLNSKFNDKTFFPFPYDEAKQGNTALSGNLGLAYTPHRNWRFTLSGSTGFRAPNVDDIGKVFESAAGEQLVVPNPGLEPEYTYSTDLGITYIIEDRLKLEAHGFYTWFRNAMVLDKFTLNGEDTLDFEGQATAIVAQQNKAKAYIYGMNAAATLYLVKGLSLYSTINYTYGRFFDPVGNTEVPLDHIPPVFGKTGITYSKGSFNAEAFALYNGWKRIADYNPFGEDNQQYATVDGMPSWYTLNLRLGYRVNNFFAVQAAVENILDHSYRCFASGINAPGRNFVVTLRGNF